MSDLTQRKCKNVISKFQRRIDKEGQQIVPLLTDLWKRGGNSTNSLGNNLLDVRKIEQRVDRFVYNGVMELVRDVQSMLKKAMQFYNLSHEVRSEARKVHDLFFDILKIAFPDTDFREARGALTFSGSTTASSTRLRANGRSKRKRSTNEDGGIDSGSSTKQRGPAPTNEGARIRVHVPQRDTKPNLSVTGREQYIQPDDSPLHPGDLVICKKKRKDRDKSAVKLRPGSSGPVSPPSSLARQIVSPHSGSSSNPKDARHTPSSAHQQGWASQSRSANGSGEVGWTNHVKRLRTDSGKGRRGHS